MKVHRAKKAGRLTPLPCEKCGAVKVDAHHDDYSKPLQVRWLCRACHRAHHAAVARELLLAC
jgi:ribosomal protein S27AE